MENVAEMNDSNDGNNLIDHSILLQFAKFSKGFRISDFNDFVQEFIGVENLECFGRLAYPNQWQIRVKNAAIREELIRIGRTRIKNRSCWMYPLNQQEIRGFIHWLPNSVTNEQLKQQLEMYGKVLFVQSEQRIIKESAVESDTRYYGLILPRETTKEDLPHFLKINSFMCLVIVRGREPACFHCRKVGHRRVECEKYKDKLTSYCNRDPNTAPPRLRPRGMRHIPVSETETQIQDIFQALERIKRKNTEALRRIFKDFENDLSQIIAKIKFPTDNEDQERRKIMEGVLADLNLEENAGKELEEIAKKICTWTAAVAGETSERTEISAEESNVEISLKEGHTIQRAHVTMEQATIAIEEALKKAEKRVEITEISTEDTTFGRDTIKSYTLMQARDSVLETSKKIPAKWEETRTKCVESVEAGVEHNAVETDTVKSAIETLKETQKDAKELFRDTCRKLEETIAEVVAPTAAEGSVTDTDTPLTEDEMKFVFRTFWDADQITTETFRQLDEKLATEIERTETTFEDSTEEKIAKGNAEDIQELRQGILELGEHFETEENISSQTKKSEMESSDDKSLQQIAETSMDFDSPTVEHSMRTAKTCKSSLKLEMAATTEVVMDLESKVSDAVETKTNDVLTKMRDIFASVFAEGTTELVPETRTLLEQVESKVNKMVVETKVCLKTEVAEIFSSSREITKDDDDEDSKKEKVGGDYMKIK